MTDVRELTYGETARATLRAAVVVLCIVALLGGCATKTQTGAVIGGATGAGVGAIVGGVLGGGKGAVLGAVLGGAIGAAAGGIIGNQIDARDKERRNAAVQASLQTARPDQQVQWVNPDTGNSGTITPGQAYKAPGSQAMCRDFAESYTRNGSMYTQQSRACLGQDGTWVMQN